MKRERVVSSSLLRIWGWHHMEGLLQSLGAWHGPWRCREDTSHPCLWRERGCSNASGGISMGGTLCSRLVPRSRPRSPLFGGRGMAARGAERLFCPQVGQEGGSRRSQQSPSLGAILQGLGGRSCTSSSSVSVTVTELAAATSPHLPAPSPSPNASWHHSGERERPDESHRGAVWDGGFPPALSPGAGGTVAYSCGSGSYCFSVAV